MTLIEDRTPCASGFTRVGPRCCASRGSPAAPGLCPRAGTCPPPLHMTDRGCDTLATDIASVPAMTFTVGPSDWEAEGRVTARAITVDAFRLDRFEVTVGRYCGAKGAKADFCSNATDDPARAAFGVSLSAARSFCESAGGRLPTEDEWLAAAAGEKTTRYPWGDTGAVCRRAAWGLETGPCANGATGPDSVGSHESMAPRGIYDLAGNVDEWVECSPNTEKCGATVRGGSYRSRLATELRTWLRREVSGPPVESMGADPAIGFRCAYAP